MDPTNLFVIVSTILCHFPLGWLIPIIMCNVSRSEETLICHTTALPLCQWLLVTFSTLPVISFSNSGQAPGRVCWAICLSVSPLCPPAGATGCLYNWLCLTLCGACSPTLPARGPNCPTEVLEVRRLNTIKTLYYFRQLSSVSHDKILFFIKYFFGFESV